MEVEYLLEADGAIFEAPIASAFLTVAHVSYYSCGDSYNTVHIVSVTWLIYTMYIHICSYMHTNSGLAMLKKLLYLVEVVLL